MTEKEAIKEIKKVERIFSKLSRNGFSVDIRECVLCFSTDEQRDAASERMDNIHYESKEFGLKSDEVIYTMDL